MTNLSLPDTKISTAQAIRLGLLGGIDLRDATGAEISRVLAQPKRLALLAYLAMTPAGRLRRRDALIGLLWAEMTETRARNSLNRSISFLRGELGAEVIASRGKEEVGIAPERLRCDAAEFDASIAAGDVERALQLYTGDFLDGFVLSGASELEDWIQRERLRLRKQACAAAWVLAKRAEDAKDLQTALRRARQAFDLDRLDEPALRRLLALLDRAGDRLGLALAYSEFATALDREFEMEPSPETRRLVELLRARVRTHTSGALPSAMPVAMPRAFAPPVAAQPIAPPAVAPQPVVATIEHSHMTPPRRRARTWRLWVTGFAAVAVAAIVLSLARSRRGAGGETPAGILVLPFAHNGSEDLAFFQDEAVNILGAKLSVPGVIATVEPQEARAYIHDGHLGEVSIAVRRSAADHFHARYVVTGRVAESRGQVRLSAELFDLRGGAGTEARLGSVEANGASSAAFALFDTLSRKLLALMPGQMTGGAAQSTQSLAALRAFMQGEALARQARFAESLDAYRLALREDSTFTLAAHRLASVASTLRRATRR